MKIHTLIQGPHNIHFAQGSGGVFVRYFHISNPMGRDGTQSYQGVNTKGETHSVEYARTLWEGFVKIGFERGQDFEF